jgi:hypothetical protein
MESWMKWSFESPFESSTQTIGNVHELLVCVPLCPGFYATRRSSC